MEAVLNKNNTDQQTSQIGQDNYKSAAIDINITFSNQNIY
jgi:hypothetical protein